MPYINPLLESLLSEEPHHDLYYNTNKLHGTKPKPYLDTNNPEAMDEYADVMQDQILLQQGKEKVKHALPENDGDDDAVLEEHYREFATKTPEELKQIINEEFDKCLETDGISLSEVTTIKTQLFSAIDKKFNKPLTEALHFGKSPELIECENLLGEVIEESKSLNPSIVEINKRIRKVENTLEKYFNFGCLTLDFTGLDILGMIVMSPNDKGKMQPSIDLSKGGTNFFVPNAYTLKKDIISTAQHHLSSDPVEHFDVSKGRLAWNDSIRPMTYIAITAGLAQVRDLTGGELLAIVLHEIGHNFYRGSVLNRTVSTLNSSVNTLITLAFSALEWSSKNTLDKAANSKVATAIIDGVYSIMLNFANIFYSIKSVKSKNMPLYISNRLSNALGPVGKYLKIGQQGIQAVQAFYTLVQKFAGVIGMAQLIAMHGFGGILYLLLDRGMSRLRAIISYASMDGTGEEKFSDQFAAMHGYGPELISGLSKMSGIEPWDHSTEDSSGATSSDVLMILAYLNSVIAALYNFGDVHPDNISRAYLLTDYYRDQMKSARTPREKKAIEDEFTRVIKNSPAYKVSNGANKEQLLKLVSTNMKTTSTIAENAGFVAVIREMLTFNGGSASEIDKLLMAKEA